jgi:hypothetical protein
MLIHEKLSLFEIYSFRTQRCFTVKGLNTIIISCDTFSVAPPIINENLKKHVIVTIVIILSVIMSIDVTPLQSPMLTFMFVIY